MNSAHAFAYAMSGSFTDQQMAQNAAYVSQNVQAVQGAGGWLASQATKIMDGFNNFLNSRAWELGKRLASKDDGEYVGRFEIGYLGTADGILGARGLMSNYIMANPGHMQAFLDGQIEGYDDLHAMCKGVGAANPYYRKARHGVLDLQHVDGKNVLSHSHYVDTGSEALPFRDIVSIDKTWNAADYHRAKGLFDIKRDASEVEPPADE
jgi:hypothetical protein